MTRIKMHLGWLIDPERNIRVVDLVDGLLITEERRGLRSRRQVWKEVNP